MFKHNTCMCDCSDSNELLRSASFTRYWKQTKAYTAEMHFCCILLILGVVFNINSEIISEQNEKKHRISRIYWSAFIIFSHLSGSIRSLYNETAQFTIHKGEIGFSKFDRKGIITLCHNGCAMCSFLFNRITWKPQPKDSLLTILWFDHDWNRNEHCKNIIVNRYW